MNCSLDAFASVDCHGHGVCNVTALGNETVAMLPLLPFASVFLRGRDAPISSYSKTTEEVTAK